MSAPDDYDNWGRNDPVVEPLPATSWEQQPAYVPQPTIHDRAARRAIVPGWQVQLKVDDTDLVSGLVPQRGIGLIVGRYGTGKSFFALDFAKHLSIGETWFGRDVAKVGCVYIAAEAGGTFDRRIVAHHLTPDHALGFIFTSIDFGKPLSMEVGDLIGQINKANAENLLGAPVRMIFVDTLARSGLKNENDSEAMNALIQNCDLIGEMTGAIVVGIHHAGWAEQRSRGHSSLPAAVDFEITVSVDGDNHTAEITKSRDGVTGDKMYFTLASVDVATRADGSPITTCIVEPVAAPERKPRRFLAKLKPEEKLALDALKNCIADHGQRPAWASATDTYLTVTTAQWRTYHLSTVERPVDTEATKINSYYKQLQRVRERLQAAEIVAKKGDHIWLIEH